jgi:hypothetical protein
MQLFRNDEALRSVLSKIKNSKAGRKIADFEEWLPDSVLEQAQVGGTGMYHVTDDIRQLVQWGLVEAHDEANQLLNLNEINDSNVLKSTFKLSEGAKLMEDALQISLTASPFFGRPGRTKTPRDLFVIMPFKEELKPIYEVTVTKVARDLGRTIGRGDDFVLSRGIMSDVWTGIFHAKIIIAECTGQNPNVFYEIGIAHTLGKETILLSQTVNDIPFDLGHLRFIIYENTPSGLAKLEESLRSNLEALLNSKSLGQ